MKMTGKERILKAIAGERVFPVPVAPHGWGVYKFQLAGVIHGPADEAAGWALSGQALAEVDALFYETFGSDMIHLSAGAWKPQPGDAERERAWRELRPAVCELNSKRLIDEFVAATTPSETEIADSGIYEHVPILAEKFGDQALILMNEGNPTCGVFENGGPAGDFQDAMAATVTHPENLAYLLWKLYESWLGRMRVLQQSGAHGYIGSETCVSCDLLSPKTFRAVVLPALKMFYEQVGSMGLVPVTYFLGEIVPILDELACMGAHALMIEEPKKGFRLEVLEIHRALAGRMALFGNLDSVYTLLWGDASAVQAETRRQCACAEKGGFISSLSCLPGSGPGCGGLRSPSSCGSHRASRP